MKYVSPNSNISRISTHDLENYLTWILTERGVPCSPKSYARRLTTLKVFFKWIKSLSFVVESSPLK